MHAIITEVDLEASYNYTTVETAATNDHLSQYNSHFFGE